MRDLSLTTSCRVRGKQPFSTETKKTTTEKTEASEDTPYVSDRVDVGEMCAFSKKRKYQIGRVLQFCHHLKKKVSEYQYQGRFAYTKQTDLGVLCTWFEEFETGTHRMCNSENHFYIPLEKYVCTLPMKCFIINESSPNVQEDNRITIKQFTLTAKCKVFILQSINMKYCSQPQQDKSPEPQQYKSSEPQQDKSPEPQQDKSLEPQQDNSPQPQNDTNPLPQQGNSPQHQKSILCSYTTRCGNNIETPKISKVA